MAATFSACEDERTKGVAARAEAGVPSGGWGASRSYWMGLERSSTDEGELVRKEEERGEQLISLPERR